MPPAKREASHELAITVDNIGRPYQAGDIITGRVTRHAHVVCPEAVIEIWLQGRTKVKLGVTRSNGQSTQTTYYRGRFNFFDETHHRIHTGPVHIPPGGSTEAWEFAVEIPSAMSPQSVLREHKYPDRGSYVPLSHQVISSQSLPTSFFAKGRHKNKHFESYVEYHLEASLALLGSHGKSLTASQPIEVRAHPPHSLASYTLRTHYQMGAASNFRLVPGMEDIKPSFKQKTQKFFHSSKVPTLGFRIHVFAPETIQLGHAAPVPFKIRIMPDQGRTTDILHNAPQYAVLTSLELVLKAQTHTLANGYTRTYDCGDVLKHPITFPLLSINNAYAVTNVDIPEADPLSPPPYQDGNPNRHPQDVKQRLPTPPEDEVSSKKAAEAGETSAPAYSRISLSNTAGESSASAASGTMALKDSTPILFPILPITWDSENAPPLDIGTLMDLRISSNRITAMGKPLMNAACGKIYPDFVSFCIKHSHSLKWKMRLEIAGDSLEFESEYPTVVLGSSV